MWLAIIVFGDGTTMTELKRSYADASQWVSDNMGDYVAFVIIKRVE